MKVSVYGEVFAEPREFVPSKNSTFETVPPLTEASAARLKFPEVEMLALFVGAVIDTTGVALCAAFAVTLPTMPE